MDIIRNAWAYLRDGYSPRSYIKDYNILETTMFMVMIMLMAILIAVTWILSFATFPVWVIPYMIYRSIKRKK